MGQHLPDRGPDAVEVAGHRDVEAGDLPALGVEEIDVGLADGSADHIGAPHRANDGVSDLGIGDEDVLDVARQIDHDRLAEAEREEARSGSLPTACTTGGGPPAAAGAIAAARPASVAIVAMRISVGLAISVVLFAATWSALE